MKLQTSTLEFPIVGAIPEIKEKLQLENTLILSAETGAGKSTIIPPSLLEEPWLKGKKIILLEPRRIAARTIAARISDLLQTKLGDEVGYRIRFDTRVSEHTKIEVVTEGILSKMLQNNDSLEEIGMVIFDEFHERSIHSDVALALCREIQEVLRPDLRILIMSATLNRDALSDLLKAPSIHCKGRQFPVEVNFGTGVDLSVLPTLVAQKILECLPKHEGDILTFLPGEGEIKKVHELLKYKAKGAQIHELYGQLSPNKQFAALLPNQEGKKKVVLATSIAETSLTIEGIEVVIDCGYTRTQTFDAKSGLSRLETLPITIDAADQRSGRAGRMGPGICYRLWSKTDHSRLRKERTPEIVDADLSSLVLELKSWGISSIENLKWMNPPSNSKIQAAEELLENIECLENNKITSHGKAVNALPCHPRIGHMLLQAEIDGSSLLSCDLAAILEEKDPLPKDSGADINLRIEALRRQRKTGVLSGRFRRIEKIASSYRKMLKLEKASNDHINPYETGLLLVYAYPERIACARPGNNAQFQLSNGRLAMIGHKDDLAHESWLAAAHVDARDGMGKIFLASVLNPKDLLPRVKEVRRVFWDEDKGAISGKTELKIGSIVLKSTLIDSISSEEVEQTLIETLKSNGENLLNWGEDVVQWQYRVESLKKWNNNMPWPEVSTAYLMENISNWLKPYLAGIKKVQELKILKIKEILTNHLTAEQQQALEKLAPEKIKVPSGSFIKIKYQPNGEIPKLSARLQELFGMKESPKVNAGNISITIQLLSPGFKPVQITSDLKSFWSKAYFEVKKELQRKYPKHYWPENPLEAEAIAGVKRKTR